MDVDTPTLNDDIDAQIGLTPERKAIGKVLVQGMPNPATGLYDIKSTIDRLETFIHQRDEARDAHFQAAVQGAEDRVIEIAHRSPCDCGSTEHLPTPVRSVTGAVTFYCQFSHVVPSGNLKQEGKTNG